MVAVINHLRSSLATSYFVLRTSYLILALCLLSAVQAAPVRNYVYILTGQSNSLGAVKGSPASAEQLERYSSRALLWNGNMVRDTGKRFEEKPAWQTVAPQLPQYAGHPCMGPEYGFAYMMQRRGWHADGASRLCIIKASLDGGGNSYWLSGGAAWKSLSSTVKTALAALKGDTAVCGLLYLQGESDKGREITLAPERFVDLHRRLQKVVRKGLRYAVAGECATWHGKDEQDEKGNTTAALMAALAAGEKKIGWVRTRDLSKIKSGDNMGVHYDGASQLTIGARYAYAVALLEKLPFTPARGDDPAAGLDTPAAWWGGKAPGAADVATWDAASATAPSVLGSRVVWAGIAVDEMPTRGVSICAAGGKEAALCLGAEGLRLVGGGLSLACDVETAADQTWEVAAGNALQMGAPNAPIRLRGRGCITLAVAPGAQVQLHLAAMPEQEWRFSSPAPQVSVTIGGKPARFIARGEVYKLENIND